MGSFAYHVKNTGTTQELKKYFTDLKKVASVIVLIAITGIF